MNKKSLAVTMFVGVLLLTGCSDKGNEALTEAQQAEKQGMTLEEYQATKEAAARMNMSVEEHMNMGN